MVATLQGFNYGGSPRPRFSFTTKDTDKGIRIQPIKAKAATTEASPFPLLQSPRAEDSPSELEPADPDFYKIGFVRSMRAYGIEFKEGPDGFGVYASKDVEPLRRARVIMEIPLELMLTISQKLPWMFFPDIVPVGHPIFDIINSTDPETGWDLRLSCLLLYAFDREDNFWQLYSDFLPSADECPSLLLASERFYGFAICLASGLTCTLLSMLVFFHPIKFAITFTLGNLLSLGSSSVARPLRLDQLLPCWVIHSSHSTESRMLKRNCVNQRATNESLKRIKFVIVSLTRWGALIFSGYKFFTGGKGKKEEGFQRVNKRMYLKLLVHCFHL
ncbi:protein PLASTID TRANSCRIPTIONALLY ACTIVE 14-like [Rosa rugosa]|uniref:protein PLASTID TRANSCRIPTIONALLY ACTIVE 14-like n=1 Tax=Rosa rugosa TaxID=74645 RepID=UPI002B41528D|nr:protein PLASTID TRANSCRIPTIONALLY ACTIVE 14-like [Rosa rugosa]